MDHKCVQIQVAAVRIISTIIRTDSPLISHCQRNNNDVHQCRVSSCGSITLPPPLLVKPILPAHQEFLDFVETSSVRTPKLEQMK